MLNNTNIHAVESDNCDHLSSNEDYGYIADNFEDRSQNDSEESIEHDINIDLSGEQGTEVLFDDRKKSFMNWQMPKFMYSLYWRPNISAKEHILVFLALSLVFHWTYESTLKILSWINKATYRGGLPEHKNSLWRALGINKQVEIRHYICEHCQAYLGTKQVYQCSVETCKVMSPSPSIGFFIQLSIESQIKDLFEIPEIYDQLQYRFSRVMKNNDSLEDVYDGKLYKNLTKPGEFLNNKHNFSFTLNTDGASVSDSSSVSAWPVFLQINELPPHLRKKHMILSTVWVGKGHPVINTLLNPMINELNQIYQMGISWKPKGSVIISKFMVLLCSVDSVARPMLLRMTQFNGAFGCTFCYQNGTSINDTIKYPFQNNMTTRLHEEIEELGINALNSGQRILGVIGPSVLFGLLGFNCLGMVVEPLHNLFLGVVKQYTSILLRGETNIVEKKRIRYVTKKMAETIIDQRLTKIRPPTRITRKPRSITESNMWKGQEWRNWIQYYCLVCFEGILRPKYYKHLSLLCQAINILNSDSITNTQIIQARKLLRKFVQDYQRFYGEAAMTYNIHLLLHIVDTV